MSIIVSSLNYLPLADETCSHLNNGRYFGCFVSYGTATSCWEGYQLPLYDGRCLARVVLAEVKALQAIFRQLDGFISAPDKQSTARKSRIQLHDLVVTLTDCVTTFSELEFELKKLGAADSTRERAKWAVKD